MGLGFHSGLGDSATFIGADGQPMGPLTPAEQAAYNAGQQSGVTPEQLQNIKDFFFAQGQMDQGPGYPSSSSNSAILLIAGAALLVVLMGDSGGRRR